MRVILLGGTWFVGRAIAEALVGAGHEVLIVHRGIAEPAGLPAVQHLQLSAQSGHPAGLTWLPSEPAACGPNGS